MKPLKSMIALILALAMSMSVAFATMIVDDSEIVLQEQTESTDIALAEDSSVEEVTEEAMAEETVAEDGEESAAEPVVEVEAVEADIEEADTEEADIEEADIEVAEEKSVGVKPADGTSSYTPFPTNIKVGHYRIPSMITLEDGTLVAAADARWGIWQQPDDCANIETIVSLSKDNGKSWSYTFANYIADNDNVRDFAAATIIDPAMVATEGNTIYMMVDLFPGQTGTTGNSATVAVAGTGYDENGNLLLRQGNEEAFDYYLSDGKVYSKDGKAVEGYTVDEYFYLSYQGEILGNLFTASTEYFQPVMTSYLYLTRSDDGGKTWSAPLIINAQVKNEDEKYYIVSPGRGLYVDGTIIFPCYRNGTTEMASFVYSTDGVNWKRSADCDATPSSEAEIVALEDGTLRMFYRHRNDTAEQEIHYIDITGNAKSGYTWGKPVSTGVAAHNNTNLSAIVLTEKYEGKQVVMVSIPSDTSGPWSRNAGRIFTFAVEVDKSMTLLNTYELNQGAFSYSSMSELANGDVAILYENGDSGGFTFKTIKKEALLPEKKVEETKPIQVGTPTVSSVKNTASGAMTVSWKKSSNATKYQIQYSTDKNMRKNVTTEDATETSLAVKGLKTDEYYVRVRAYHASSKQYSKWSSVKSVKVVAVGTPTISSVKNSGKGKLTVKWSKASQATNYEVQYATTKDMKKSVKKITSGTSLSVGKLTKKKTYYVRVRAYKVVNGTKMYSSWSSTKSVKISR